jgi:hypothetical protein
MDLTNLLRILKANFPKEAQWETEKYGEIVIYTHLYLVKDSDGTEYITDQEPAHTRELYH